MSSESFRSNSDVIESLPEYRPLSFVAIAAVVLMLPGCLAVFHSAFLIFPFMAIALSLVALRQAAKSESKVSGRRAALAALFLSLLLVCFAISLHLSNSQREYHFATNCAKQWLRLLRGENPREAYLLTLGYDLRPTEAAEAVPSSVRKNNAVILMESQQSILNQPGIQMLANPANRVEFTGLAGKEFDGKRAFYRLIVNLYAPESTPSDHFAIIRVQGFPGRDGVEHWQIGNCDVFVKQTGAQIK